MNILNVQVGLRRLIYGVVITLLSGASLLGAGVTPPAPVESESGADLPVVPAWVKRVLYVDDVRGDDSNNGLSALTAWKSLHRAAELVRPGDYVRVAQGIYRGGINIKNKGSAAQPIAFVAADRSVNAVIVTNADSAIRSRKELWKLKDAALGLYYASYESGWPARVLYSGIDLFPYGSVQELTQFTICKNVAGPQHGYTYDPKEKLVYVRLNATGRYGSSDPNAHVMAVAPPTGTQFDGSFVTDSSHYNIGILGSGPAHVILDGFTFETPGVGGVYVEGDDVIIRRCWFRGCRVGVVGNYSDKLPTPDSVDYMTYLLDPDAIEKSAARIVIEYCDYSQHPAFQDVVDAMQRVETAGVRTKPRKEKMALIWARKDIYSGGVANNRLKYEMGIAARITKDWTIRRNTIHDTMEGLSCHGTSASVGLRLLENVFERICDNGVETEDHARDMRIERNFFIDNFEPFSWQPLRGTPWPGPIYVYQNVFVNTETYSALWSPVTGLRSAFKIGAKLSNWEKIRHMKGIPTSPLEVPPPGLLIFNNTVYMKNCRLITPQGNSETPLGNVHFLNNVFATDYLVSINPKQDLKPGIFDFLNNAVVPAHPGVQGPGLIAAGKGGQSFSQYDELKLSVEFRPQPDSPLINRAVPTEGDFFPLGHDIGAFQTGGGWRAYATGPLAPEEKFEVNDSVAK